MCIIRGPTMVNKQGNASIFGVSGDAFLYLY